MNVTFSRMAAGAALALTGCGGAAVPHSQMSDSQAALRAAEAKDAGDIPQGQLHLKLARDQISQAEGMIAEGDNAQADLVLQRAEADAELALALAQAEDAREAAQQAQERIDELEQR